MCVAKAMNVDDWNARVLAVTFQIFICFFVIYALTLGNKSQSVFRKIFDQSGELQFKLSVEWYFENGCCSFNLGKAADVTPSV